MGIRRIANAVKVGQRWERLIVGPSGWKPRKIKRVRGRGKKGRMKGEIEKHKWTKMGLNAYQKGGREQIAG